MKTCATCLVDKPPSSFNSDSTKHDGLRKSCKACRNIRRRGIRHGLIEKPKAKPRPKRSDDPAWVKAKAERIAENKRLRRARRRQREKILMTDWQKQKRKAREKARRAIWDGKIVKSPCEVCGDVKVEAHHDDYFKPLVVRFLCQKHHQEWHRMVPSPRNGGGPISKAGDTV